MLMNAAFRAAKSILKTERETTAFATAIRNKKELWAETENDGRNDALEAVGPGAYITPTPIEFSAQEH